MPEKETYLQKMLAKTFLEKRTIKEEDYFGSAVTIVTTVLARCVNDLDARLRKLEEK